MLAMRARQAKGLLVTVATAGFVVATVYVIHLADETNAGPGGAPPPHEGPPPEAPPEAKASPRDTLLATTAAQAGVAPVRGVWGVLMERGFAKGVATVVALADGTATMHLSTGGSVVGGKTYPPAHEAAQKLCERAADALGETVTTREFPAPTKGHVRFYVLTPDGVRTAELDLFAHPDAGGEPLAPLLAAGDAVLDALKDATSKGLIR